jgi:hypothetical protein
MLELWDLECGEGSAVEEWTLPGGMKACGGGGFRFEGGVWLLAGSPEEDPPVDPDPSPGGTLFRVVTKTMSMSP